MHHWSLTNTHHEYVPLASQVHHNFSLFTEVENSWKLSNLECDFTNFWEIYTYIGVYILCIYYTYSCESVHLSIYRDLEVMFF